MVPTYSRATLIASTIDAVREQTHEDWELIVVDDGSEDDTADVVRGIHDPRIRLVTHPSGTNHGPAASRLLGCKVATAEVVALLDNDDLWEPEYLAAHLDFWRAHDDVAMSYGPVLSWWSDGIPRDGFTGAPAPGVYPPGSLLVEWVRNKHATAGVPSATFLRPDLYPNLVERWVDEARRSGSEDQYLKFPAAARYTTAVHDLQLVRYRRHDVSVSGSRPPIKYLQDHLALYENLADDLDGVLPGHPIHAALRRRRREIVWELRRRVARRWVGRQAQRIGRRSDHR